MDYTEQEQASLDLDWFAVDSEGQIAHFASAGRPLPKSVSQSQEDNKFVSNFFRSLPGIGRLAEADPEITLHVSFEGPEMQSRYLTDFESMGIRGLFSYDTTLPGTDLQFFRVYSPNDPLKIADLPPEVAVILQLTQYGGKFHVDRIIKAEDIS
jgi:hypothetical protein